MRIFHTKCIDEPRRAERSYAVCCTDSFVKGEYKDRVIDNAVTEMGSHLTFDITELFSSKVNIQQETLTFVVCAAAAILCFGGIS